MKRLIKNGDIILDGTLTRKEKEKEAFTKLEIIEKMMDAYHISSYMELDYALWKYMSEGKSFKK